VAASLAPPAGARFYGTVFPGGPPAYLLGPTSAICQGAWSSADDGSFMTASSTSSPSQIVTMVLRAGGAGPETDLACPYIPATLPAEQALRGNTSLCTRPSEDVVQQIPIGGTNFYAAVVWVPAKVKDPNLTGSGNGTDPTVALYTAEVFPPQAGYRAQSANAQMISCTLPTAQRDICAAALKYFLFTQSVVGTHLSAARLVTMWAASSAFLARH